MDDGAFETLEEVETSGKTPLLRPPGLTGVERVDLVALLEGLGMDEPPLGEEPSRRRSAPPTSSSPPPPVPEPHAQVERGRGWRHHRRRGSKGRRQDRPPVRRGAGPPPPHRRASSRGLDAKRAAARDPAASGEGGPVRPAGRRGRHHRRASLSGGACAGRSALRRDRRASGRAALDRDRRPAGAEKPRGHLPRGVTPRPRPPVGRTPPSPAGARRGRWRGPSGPRASRPCGRARRAGR